MLNNHIDYDSVADLYDTYVSTDIDIAFFKDELAQVSGPVLELASGTGRLSIPLIESGTQLTCVDCCQQMLDVLSHKLADHKLEADISCQDICTMALPHSFSVAILPFQSFMEIVGEQRQRAALASVFAALCPNSRFVCTMHNPNIRRKTVDGKLHLVGSFPYRDGILLVSGFECGGDPVVSRSQIFEYYNQDGLLSWKRLLPMEFEFIEAPSFEKMADDIGFIVEDVYGDYLRNPFNADTSSVMIWRLRKPA